MKTIKAYINENMILESVCKDIDTVRAGQELYVHVSGAKEITKLKVANVAHVRHERGSKSRTTTVEFVENPILSAFEYMFFDTIKKQYPNPKTVITDSWGGKRYIIAISQEYAEAAVKSSYEAALKGTLSALADAREKVAKLEKEVAELSASLGKEIEDKVEESRQT